MGGGSVLCVRMGSVDGGFSAPAFSSVQSDLALPALHCGKSIIIMI